MSRRHRQLTYYPPAAPERPEPEPESRPDALWGWTLPELHGIARVAAVANKWLVSDVTIRYEAAWDGLVDELLAAGSRPTARDLAAVAKGAVSRTLLKDFAHTYGVADRDLMKGIGSAPRFAGYWFDRGPDPFDDRVAERVAIAQVMGSLRPVHRESLETLAAAGNLAAGAEMLGTRRGTFQARAREARKAFEARWYAPESPPSRRRRPVKYSPSADNEARKAPCGTPQAWRRHKRNGEEIDEACDAAGKAHDRERTQARRAARKAAA